MSLSLKAVGILVKDMPATLAFYRALGLDVPEDSGEPNIEVTLPSGLVLGFLTEAMASQADPNFVPPTGSSLNLQFEASTPAEVDALHARLLTAGYKSYAAPWDAFWGQHFARVLDPDSRIVNLYADL